MGQQRKRRWMGPRACGLAAAIGEFVDATAGQADIVCPVTFTGVGPVEDVNTAVWTIVEVDAYEPGILEKSKVGLVPPRDARALSFQSVLVDASPVQVQGEDPSSVLFGPILALVNHQAAMSVTATQCVGSGRRVSRVLPCPSSV